MLSVHVVRDGGFHYYVDDLVPGRAEGSLVAGEEAGSWTGGGSGALHLRGIVGAEEFEQVLEGRDPSSGRRLRQPHGDRSVAGFDLTFGAPKSVSILHLLAPREIGVEVGSGHQAAVMEAAGYLSRAGVGVRRAHGDGVALMASTGMVGGQFLHRTSRALDPHLHTHLVAANVAQGVDGSWSAIDSRKLFAHIRAARSVYHAVLRMELGDRIGASWNLRRSGLGDVVGVDPSLQRLFSQRSAGMDEHDSRHRGRLSDGLHSKAAFHADRPDKDRTQTVDSLTARWKDRATDLGFDLGDLTKAVGPRRPRQAEPVIDERRVCQDLSELAFRGRALAHRDLVAVVATASTSGAPARSIENVATVVTMATPRLRQATAWGSDGLASRASSGTQGDARWPAADLLRVVEAGQLSEVLSERPQGQKVRASRSELMTEPMRSTERQRARSPMGRSWHDRRDRPVLER
jgi:conjugative relaxase-like TrwC/TraI family protein